MSALKPADSVTNHLLAPRAYPSRLSLVIPLFNEEAVIPLLREAVDNFARDLSCNVELLLVNDGSSDGTLALLAEWANSDARVKVLHLSRNFGHQIAATAGKVVNLLYVDVPASEPQILLKVRFASVDRSLEKQ